jgi:predicted RNA-binding Zn-ribbon protein involved in translation (DUF1610 family)
MTKYIERGALIEALAMTEFLTMQDAATAIQLATEAPAADVEPVVRGTWEEHPIADTTDEGEQYVAMFWQCSNCHGKLIYWNFQRTKYCPDCGAHMMERSGSGE